MASSFLGSSGTGPKNEVSQRSSQRASQHDPAVVRHEDEPFVCVCVWSEIENIQAWKQNWKAKGGRRGNLLHDHERIKVLDPIQDRLDGVGPLGDCSHILP